VNDSLSKMRQGSETAERRETEQLPVVASVYESIVVLPRTKIWSYRERRGFVDSRCQAQGARRASLSGNTRERKANVRERRRTTTTISAPLFFYYDLLWSSISTLRLSSVLWIL
jgi:hypothetical protein